MASVLVSGNLGRDPLKRESKAGRQYVTSVVREQQGDHTVWWNISVFGEEEIAEIMAMRKGDAIAVSGLFRGELYTPDGGATRISLGITVNRLITPRRRNTERREEQRRGNGSLSEASNQFDDDLPF